MPKCHDAGLNRSIRQLLSELTVIIKMLHKEGKEKRKRIARRIYVPNFSVPPPLLLTQLLRNTCNDQGTNNSTTVVLDLLKMKQTHKQYQIV